MNKWYFIEKKEQAPKTQTIVEMILEEYKEERPEQYESLVKIYEEIGLSDEFKLSDAIGLLEKSRIKRQEIKAVRNEIVTEEMLENYLNGRKEIHELMSEHYEAFELIEQKLSVLDHAKSKIKK